MRKTNRNEGTRNFRGRADRRQPLSGNQFQTFGCQSSALLSELTQVLDTRSFRDAYLLSSLTSKLGSAAVPELTREKRAIEGWYADEEFNTRTSARLERFWHGEFHDKLILGVPLRSLISEAASIISDLLPEWDHSFYEHSCFTNGAAVGYGKQKGDPWYKYDGTLTATPLAYSRVYSLVSATPVWHQHLALRFGSRSGAIHIVPGEHGFTVPKNAETDRYCSKQPTGNMLLQKAQGYVIRQSLKAVGINLDDQRRNRLAAFRASITGKDATIDLKSASNSLVCWLVTLLLPPSWVNELMVARSPLCRPSPDSPWVKTEMIGAMGNGFTFELESMIFYALAEACRRLTRSRGRTLVYGDDIVTPVACVHHVIALLGFCGFRINRSKSFWTGWFRESCGGHYLRGEDVTPIYIRKPITDTTRMIWFLNKLRAWASSGWKLGVADERVWPLYKRLRRKYVCSTLWGGVRSESITSLFGPGEPRMRLVFEVERKRLTGRPALLRTFQYMSPSASHLHSRLAKCHGDVQAYFELFGSLPITASMERLTSVSESPVAVQANVEQFSDPLMLFASEIAEIDDLSRL